VKNLLLVAGVLLLALGLVWLLVSDGGGRPSAVAPAPAAPRRLAERAPEVAAPGAPVSEFAAPAAARVSSVSPTGVPTRHLRGTVLAPGGDRVAARAAVYARGELVAEQATAADGSFSLGVPVPSLDVVLRVEAEGHAALEHELGDQLQAGDLELGSLWLQPGVPVEGLVRGPSGAPVAGAEVRLAIRRSRPSEYVIGDRTTTDAAGRFRFPAAPAALVVVRARAAGLGESSKELTARDAREIEITLEPERVLSVRTIDRDGAPIAGADVELRSEDPAFPPRKRTTDAEGRVRFEALGAREWNVLALARGYKPAPLPGAWADGGEIVLELRPWPSITGRLVAPGGAALPAEARVLALPRVAAQRGDASASPLGGEPAGAEGRFRLSDLRPGDYVVRATAPGFAPTLSYPVTVGGEGTVSIGELVLQRGGTLELAVRARGAPLAGVEAELLSYAPAPAQAFLAPGPAEPGTAASDAEGRLVLSSLVPGNTWVVLRGPETVPEIAGPFWITNEVTSGPIRVDLQPGTRLVGRILRETTREPLVHGRLTARGPAGSVPLLETDEQGRFRSVPLPPGTYTLDFGAGRLTPSEIRLEAGAELEAQIELAAAPPR
jgi:hypothetical protein